LLYGKQDRQRLQVDDLERLMLQNQQMDQRLAQCMSKLSREDHLAIFGDMFDTEAAENKA
jgi:hypothetical protein